MQLNEEQGSKRKCYLAFIAGMLSTIAGLWLLKPAWTMLMLIYKAGEGQQLAGVDNLIFSVLCLTAVVATVVAGISLIVSALRSKNDDLIPGPTLYFLGLSLTAIGGFLIINTLLWQAVTAVLIGSFLIYWEWKYHVI